MLWLLQRMKAKQEQDENDSEDDQKVEMEYSDELSQEEGMNVDEVTQESEAEAKEEDVDDWRSMPEFEYFSKYPQKIKSWFDLDFKLIGGELARLRWSCQCGAGIAMQGMCQHAASCLWMLYFAAKKPEELDFLRSRTRQQKKMFRHTTNMEVHHRHYKEKNLEEKQDWCWIRKKNEVDQYRMHCEGCKVWYHPECLGQSTEVILRNPQLLKVWMCPHCEQDVNFAFRKDRMLDELYAERGECEQDLLSDDEQEDLEGEEF